MRAKKACKNCRQWHKHRCPYNPYSDAMEEYHPGHDMNGKPKSLQVMSKGCCGDFEARMVGEDV